jgi:folate-binding protein YgfZ
MSNPRVFDRKIVRISPTDASENVRAFLQGLVTQDTEIPAPGISAWSALLTPQGKILFDFFLFADASAPMDILIDVEAKQADALIKRLSLYRLRRKILIARDDNIGVYWSATGGGPFDPRLPELGHRWTAPVQPDDQDVSGAYRLHRLPLGVCEGIAELGDGTTLWLECNAAELNGVSFTKGCYIGQENTARMNWRSTVNRRMVVVPLSQADPARQRIAYPELGLSVEHRRVTDMTDLDLPAWLADAIAPPLSA